MNNAYNKKNSEYSSKTQITEYRLILLNDNINSFDHVIQSLVEICKFDYEKAEQCTLLTHLKGQYQIMSGDKEKLEKIQKSLRLKKLNALIKTK